MESDSELVARCRGGDRRAFDALVQRHYAMACRIASRYAALSDDAQDLAQEAFVAAFRNLDQLQQPERLAAWLGSIVRNQGRMWQRRRSLQPSLLPLQEDGAEGVPGLGLAAIDAARAQSRRDGLREAVAAALARLTPEQRQAVRLHYLDGWDYRETASLLSVPVAAVRGRLARARGALRKELLAMEIASDTGWLLDRRDLQALGAAAMTASQDPERATINSVFLDRGHLVATDTHRVFCYTAPSLQGIPPVIVHADLGRALREQHPHACQARLVLADGAAALRLPGGEEIRAPLVEPPYPKWERVVPSEWAARVVAPVADWLAALEVLSRYREGQPPAADPEYPERILIVLEPGQGRLSLRAGQEAAPGSRVSSEISVSFPAQVAPDTSSVVMAANAHYLEQAVRGLGVSDDGLVELAFAASAPDAPSSLCPFLVQPMPAERTFFITMPMALPSSMADRPADVACEAAA